MKRDKFRYPIVPHELAGGVDCCGYLIVVEHGVEADLICNECNARIGTMPVGEVESTLLRLAMEGGMCSVKCGQCGALQTVLGFDSTDAFVCRECGKGNLVPTRVQ